MRSEQLFFVFVVVVVCFCFPIKRVFPAENSKKRGFGKKKLNLLKLSYPRYKFVKVDNSKD